MSRAKKVAQVEPVDVERFEARLARLVAEIGEAVCDETLENQVYYARFTLRNGLRNGYSAIAGETWDLRIRRAAANVAYRFGQVERPPGALNAQGFNVPLFKVRLQRLQSILSHYSPAEFARECARLARSADPRVLTEDEFQ